MKNVSTTYTRNEESSSEGEDESGSEGKDDDEGEVEDKGGEGENEDDEVIYFRAYVVRKYVRTLNIKMSSWFYLRWVVGF
ncbi:hypothetical protein Glove_196g110 [Diversispora epigaea]|uniref:Uncharacterized protein n=1 Tax=Diversispora epigaea TaxID=1348612 RepID=A0A397ITV3_9GLOM|nr:hypothetical protein Glove_196g110 [Diversispora epigaea]